jgi:hypothetical protein
LLNTSSDQHEAQVSSGIRRPSHAAQTSDSAGVDVTQATAAVLLSCPFQLAVPALLGVPAFVSLRRNLLRADQPALVCAPLALEGSKLRATAG